MAKGSLFFRTMLVFLLVSVLLPLSGCITFNHSKKESQQKAVVIDNLNREIVRLNMELTALQRDRSELERTKLKLEEKLIKELDTNQTMVQMQERGLVVTVLAEVLFDPGKAVLKTEYKTSLDKIVEVLKENVPDKQIIIEGHTDSDPIKYSGWKSNWDLSAGRATSIIHHFVKEGEFDPERLSVAGYGDQRPIASNDTKEGKAKNRRVEIIILPHNLVKEKPGNK